MRVIMKYFPVYIVVPEAMDKPSMIPPLLIPACDPGGGVGDVEFDGKPSEAFREFMVWF